MSLKALHIIFITASTLLSFVFGVWAMKSYAREGAVWDLVLGVLALVTGVALVIYGRYFLKKLKDIGML